MKGKKPKCFVYSIPKPLSKLSSPNQVSWELMESLQALLLTLEFI